MSAVELDPFADEDLDVVLEDDDERTGFKITNDHVASWALRKLWKAEREKARLKRNHQDAVDVLNAQLADAVAIVDHDVRFFEGALGDYHRRLRASGEAEKTYKLPAGELHERKTPEGVEVVDLAALQDYAEGADHLNLIRIRVEADKRAILAALKSTGEAIPGVEVRSGDVRYSAKPYDIGLAE